MNNKNFARYFAYLTAAFPAVNVPSQTFKVYYSQLSDLGDEIVEMAIARCIRECKFWPTVSEIRDRAASIVSDQEGVTRAWADTLLSGGYVPAIENQPNSLKRITGE